MSAQFTAEAVRLAAEVKRLRSALVRVIRKLQQACHCFDCNNKVVAAEAQTIARRALERKGPA